jgi:nicotinamidase-related amidase
MRFKDSALILIDVQKGFDDPYWGNRCNPSFESNVGKLLRCWRENDRKIFHVQHRSTNMRSPLHPSTPGVGFMHFALPSGSEQVFEKNVNSAFIGTQLEKTLRDFRIESLVVVGLSTDHCVSTSVRMAANLGFQVTLVSDATATFERTSINGEIYPAELVHEISLASLNGEFANVISTEEVLASLKPDLQGKALK